VDPIGDRVFVSTNVATNNVTVLNATTGLVVGALSATGFPDAIAVDGSAHEVYVAEFQTESVAIFNETTGGFLKSVSVAGGPDGIAFDNSTGNLYVATAGSFSDNVNVIKGTTGEVVAHISLVNPYGPVAAFPMLAVAFDSATDRIYVASAPNNISVIDPSNESIVENLSVGSDPTALAVGLGGGRLYVANQKSDNVSIIDALTGSIVGSVYLGAGSSPMGLTFNPESGDLYVTEGTANTVAVVNTTTYSVEQLIRVGSEPGAVVTDPVGRVLVAETGSNNITVIDGQTDLVVGSLYATGSHPVTFHAIGLPAGSLWGVTVSPYPATNPSCWLWSQDSSASSVTFYAPSGPFGFYAEAPPGYVTQPALPATGTVEVNGTGVSISVPFSPTLSPPKTFLGLPVPEAYYLLGGVVGAGTIAAIAFAVRRRGVPKG
jgi:YVTN family beta-propeller protein